MTGTVIRSTGSWYTVKTEDGHLHECRLKGKLRLEGLKTTNPVAVGDVVKLEFGEEEDAIVISGIEPRDNYIIRQSPKHRNASHILAANIDQAFVLVTISKPRTSTGFIDRFLVTAEAYHIPTHVIFNKQDALTDKDRDKQEEYIELYERIGYPTHRISALSGEGVEEVKAVMKEKRTLLSGHSGVGKSTFVNAIYPELGLRTQEVSKKFQKGTHTTTFAEMFSLPFGGEIIDTPGIKEFGVLDFEPEEISHYFNEMQPLIGSCKFNNCLHDNEPGCAIQEAVMAGDIHPERYKNYLNILDSIKGQVSY